MASNDYHFLTHWRIAGSPAEVFAILDDPLSLTQWWPQVYLEVIEIEPGDQDGVGRVVQLHTKGWLPYTLRWSFRAVEKRVPEHLALEAWGDFVGRGVWTITPAATPGETDVTYDWRIRADKPLLRYLSWLMKPIFAANHRWAMDRGRESLQREVLRRRTLPAATA